MTVSGAGLAEPGHPAGRAQHAAHGRVEPPVRALQAAVGAVRRTTGRSRRPTAPAAGRSPAPAPGRRSPAAIARRPPTSSRNCWTDGCLLLRGQPLGGLEHHRPGGVALVVVAQRPGERAERLGLGHGVQVPALGQHQVHVGEGLEPGAEPRGRAAYPLGDRAHTSVLAGQQRDDPVGLGQLVGAQHDRLVSVERHVLILLRRWARTTVTRRYDAGRSSPRTSSAARSPRRSG